MNRRRFIASILSTIPLSLTKLPSLSVADLHKTRVMGSLDVTVNATVGNEPRIFLFKEVPAYLYGIYRPENLCVRLKDVLLEVKETTFVGRVSVALRLRDDVVKMVHYDIAQTVPAGGSLNLQDIRLTIT